MPTRKQRPSARKNVRKAGRRWGSMGSRERARSHPHVRSRRRPGATGEGEYYHVEVRPKSEFVTFRTQDVGRKGHIQRVAGKRSSGSWLTAKWLISKEDAHVSEDRLVGDTPEAKGVIEKLGSTPIRIQGDRFLAKDRPNVPETAKPTPAQRRARRENLQKAREARAPGEAEVEEEAEPTPELEPQREEQRFQEGMPPHEPRPEDEQGRTP